MKNSQTIRALIQIILGAIATVVFNLIFFVGFLIITSGTLSSLPFMPLLTRAVYQLGLFQSIYVIPLCIYLNRRRQRNYMKGVIIGACTTALLNGACWWTFQTLPHY